MWLRLARPSYRIASTLFALMALVTIGFATSPASFEHAGSKSPYATLAAVQADLPADDHAASPAGDHNAAASDEPHSLDALVTHPWQSASRMASGPGPARAPSLSRPVSKSPDQPPPRA